MKKLTAGIFTVLLGLVTVNAADAAVASRGYVLQEVGKVDKSLTDYMTANDQAIADMDAAYKQADTAINNKIGTVAEGKTVVSLIEEAKTAASTGASEALDAYKATTNKAISDMDAAYKAADNALDAAYKAADEAINQTIATNKQAAVDGLALKEDKSNKVTTVDESSTDEQYASAKAVYTLVSGEIEGITEDNAVWQSGVEQSINDLTAADTTINGRIDGVEAAYKAADVDLETSLKGYVDGKDSAQAQALATAKSDLTAAIATAKSEAITDAENKNTALETSLKTYVDGKDTAQTQALADAKSDLEGQIATATSGAGSNLAAAKTELEGKITTAETNAKDYALTKANAAMSASVQYTDDVVEGLKLAEIARVPAACSKAANYCALTTNGTNFIWEVIERATGETLEGTPVTVPDTVAATKPAALTK